MKVMPLIIGKKRIANATTLICAGWFIFYLRTKSESILMKIQHILIAAATTLLLTAGNAWAGVDHRPVPVRQIKPQPVIPVKPKPIVVVTPKPVIVVPPKPVVVVFPPKGPKGGGHHKAPEIDAASGTSAIALLTGVLLLAGERVQSRRA